MEKTKKIRKARFVGVRMTQAQGAHLDELARQESITASEALRRLVEAAKGGMICTQ